MQPFRLTALPALLMLPAWPVFMLLPARFAGVFFLLSGGALITFVAGPLYAVGLFAAVLLGYVLTEWTAGRTRRSAAADFACLGAFHIAYWACFYLPLPEIFQADALRPADRALSFIMFSGIGLTFLRLVGYFRDRIGGTLERVGLADYLAYMLFFPQFRHGPLERCGPFTVQLRDARRQWRPRDLGFGMLRVVWALFLGWGFWRLLISVVKRLNADGSVNALANPEALTPGEFVVLIHLPAIVLYAVGSAGAHLQLGVSRCFGIVGSENYNHPYRALSPRTLWTRWNITLSFWLRDYAFKPLGGYRKRRYLNIILTFVYAGLIHGLQLRFLVWGLWCGGTVALATYLRQRLPGRERERRTHAGPLRRVIRSTILGLGTIHWACISVIIIIDPDYCGLRVLRQYVVHLLKLLNVSALWSP